MVAVCFSCDLFPVHTGRLFICPADPELSGPTPGNPYMGLHAPDLADPVILVVFRLGRSGLDPVLHDHRHDIRRCRLGSGMVLVHLPPDQGISVPE